jgi:hypothetical protein
MTPARWLNWKHSFPCAALSNDAEEPQDEDQQQQTAKTDIHDHSSRFRVVAVTVRQERRSIRYEHVI